MRPSTSALSLPVFDPALVVDRCFVGRLFWIALNGQPPSFLATPAPSAAAAALDGSGPAPPLPPNYKALVISLERENKALKADLKAIRSELQKIKQVWGWVRLAIARHVA
jgi:hypothetical protein